ncbi:helix-turn-helix domain-containing protein [soil metagenome]
MLNQSAFTLVNPQNCSLAFNLFSFEEGSCFDHIQRNNYFSLIWITEGNGSVKSDFSEYNFEENVVFAFAPYQPYMIVADKQLKGVVINFHSGFFCIHKHQDEIATNGVLYNNVYQPPFVKVDESSVGIFKMVFEQMVAEMQNSALAQHELLVSYLKIFLITASRLKVEQQTQAREAVKDNKEPFILQKLKDAIEANFKTKHAPAQYAEILYISPKALAKIARKHFNKTLSDLIAERIIIEAKRELYLTNKSVKEIAYELGYDDEYYFSRFFKINADVSPQIYRSTVGFNKGAAVA